MDYIRLPLEGAKNVRDLGGICTLDNKITKFHIFVRGSNLKYLTKNDNEILKRYNISDIIDLRGNTSIQNNFVSDDNINKSYFNFHHIPLSNIDIEQYVLENTNNKDFNYGEGYFLLLKNREKVKAVFDVLLAAKGGVLFHCTAGKDRTGVIAALILGACNIDDIDIISNYEVTYTYIKNEEFLQNYEKKLRKSDAKYMETFITRLKEKYGGVKEYLISCGITTEEIKRLKDKFLKEII